METSHSLKKRVKNRGASPCLLVLVFTSTDFFSQKDRIFPIHGNGEKDRKKEKKQTSSPFPYHSFCVLFFNIFERFYKNCRPFPLFSYNSCRIPICFIWSGLAHGSPVSSEHAPCDFCVFLFLCFCVSVFRLYHSVPYERSFHEISQIRKKKEDP